MPKYIFVYLCGYKAKLISTIVDQYINKLT